MIKPAQPNQSLMDGLECLEAVALAERPVGVRELARMLQLEPTRVSRLLGTLAYLGLTQRTGRGKYAPGPGIHVLSAMGLRGSRLLASALPVIRELQVGHGYSVALGVLWRRHVCYLFHGLPGRPLEEGIGGHGLFPAEQSSIGLALLADRPEAAVRTLFAGDAAADINRLLSRLVAVRQAGYAVAPDHGSLAVAVGDVPFAALAFSSFPTAATTSLIAALQLATGTIATSLNPA